MQKVQWKLFKPIYSLLISAQDIHVYRAIKVELYGFGFWKVILLFSFIYPDYKLFDKNELGVKLMYNR